MSIYIPWPLVWGFVLAVGGVTAELLLAEAWKRWRR